MAVVAGEGREGLKGVLGEFQQANGVVERGGGDEQIILLLVEIDRFDGSLVGHRRGHERIFGVVKVNAAIVAPSHVVVLDGAEAADPVWEVLARFLLRLADNRDIFQLQGSFERQTMQTNILTQRNTKEHAINNKIKRNRLFELQRFVYQF